MRILPGFALLLITSVSMASSKPYTIVVGGEASMKVLKPLQGDIEKIVGGAVRLAPNASDAAMLAIQTAQVDMGTFAIPLPGALKLAEKVGGKPDDKPENYETFAITKVTVQLGLHPQNSVRKLDKQQLTDIFSKKISNWKEVGGEDKKIRVLLGNKYPMLRSSVPKFYLNSETFPAAEMVGDHQGILRAMKLDPGVLGIFLIEDKLPDFEPKFLDSEVNFPVFLVSRKQRTPMGNKVFDFLKSKAEASK